MCESSRVDWANVNFDGNNVDNMAGVGRERERESGRAGWQKGQPRVWKAICLALCGLAHGKHR